MGLLLFMIVVIVILRRSYVNLAVGDLNRILVSTIATLIYVVSLFSPGLLQVFGDLRTKLVISGRLNELTYREFDMLVLRWCLELTIIFVVEIVAVRAIPVAKRGKLQMQPPGPATLAVAYLCVGIGVLTIVLGPEATLEDRAAPGVGFVKLLQAFLVSGLAILAYYFKDLSKLHRLLLALGSIFLATSYVRSPLVVLAIALLIGVVHRGGLRSKRSIVFLVVFAIVAIFVGVTMSAVRASIIRETNLSVGQTVEAILSEPLNSVFASGVDTLDGYRFTRGLSTLDKAYPLDPFMVVGTFVPRSIWPSKPDEISVSLSRDYLGYQQSGQFLSPVGYLTLVAGDYRGGLLLLGGFVWLLVRVGVRFQGIFTVVVGVVAFRFFLGGSAFDVAYGLRLAIPWVILGFAGRREVATPLIRRTPTSRDRWTRCE